MENVLACVGILKAKHIRVCAAILDSKKESACNSIVYATNDVHINIESEALSNMRLEDLRQLAPNALLLTSDVAAVTHRDIALGSLNYWDNHKEVAIHTKVDNYRNKTDLLAQAIYKNESTNAFAHLLEEVTSMWLREDGLYLYTSCEHSNLYYLVIPEEGFYCCSDRQTLEVLKKYSESEYEVGVLSNNQIFKVVIEDAVVQVRRLQAIRPLSRQTSQVPTTKERTPHVDSNLQIPVNQFEIANGLYYLNGEKCQGVYYTKVDGSFVSLSPFKNGITVFFYAGVLLKNVEAVKELSKKDVIHPSDLQGFSATPIPADLFAPTRKKTFLIPEAFEWTSPFVGVPLAYVNGDFYYPFTGIKYTFENNTLISKETLSISSVQRYWPMILPDSTLNVRTLLGMLHNIISSMEDRTSHDENLAPENDILRNIREYLSPHINNLK